MPEIMNVYEFNQCLLFRHVNINHFYVHTFSAFILSRTYVVHILKCLVSTILVKTIRCKVGLFFAIHK
jgi:hypothetical protein